MNSGLWHFILVHPVSCSSGWLFLMALALVDQVLLFWVESLTLRCGIAQVVLALPFWGVSHWTPFLGPPGLFLDELEQEIFPFFWLPLLLFPFLF
jgi:hypothetical protein